MKRIVCILLAISTSAAQFLNAQTCPDNPTYRNKNGTYDLSSGRSIVLDNGKKFKITVQNNFSATSSICILNGSSLTLTFQNVNAIEKGGSINIDKNSDLTIPNAVNKFPLTVNNSGTVQQSSSVTFTDGATLINSGTYNISGTVTLNDGSVTFTNSGSLSTGGAFNDNSSEFVLTNAVNSTISLSGNLTLSATKITNSGTFNNSGFVTLQKSCVVANKGYMNISGNLISGETSFTNNGVLFISGNTVINSGTFDNTCTLKGSGTFTNNSSVNNTGNILLNSSFTNQGSFTNGTTGFVQGSNFTNNNSISGGGNFYFSGNTTNQGPFTGGDNQINFYDASNNSDKYFDTQNTVPVNTTKNQISPNNATSFSTCSEEVVPVITSQPQTQVLCSTSVKETKFGVSASSKTTPTYQWYKNEKPIPGATSSVFSISNLTLADTANFYNVVVTNTAGSVWSNAAYIKFVIISQPSPATQFLATGNAASFTIKTSGVKTWQWQKDGSNISGATSAGYSIPVVNSSDAGKYSVFVHYDGGTCTSEPAVLKTSVVLYSKPNGDINQPATWGIEANGSGSTPVDFTRDEHTFVLANRNTFETSSDLAIAGTLDLSYCRLTITPNTTLQVGRVTRSSSTAVAASGVIAASSTANLTINGIASAAYADTSDLYFDEKNNTIHNLITASHSVTLHNPLNIASGKNSGFLQVNSGDFQTSDLLTLQSDSLGTGSIAKSAGTITGKVTIEKYIHARRAWRLMGAPITNTDAPTINAAWQEGSVSSSDNPHPGYGTHITFGAESDGFDRNPQKTFSMKIRTGSGWVGVPATNKTAITDYPAYFIFVRGDRSYNIATTTNYTKPTSTILRVTGNVYQGAQAAKTVATNGLTLVANPYASPVNFAKIISASSNIQTRIRVWDPTLAGVYGVGGWITVDGSTGKYRATPPSANASAILQAGQGFFVESGNNTSTGSVIINEDAKDLTAATINGDRMDDDVTADTSMEINLKVLNPDSSAAIADGVLYIFNAANNNAVDGNDAVKLNNFNENLGIKEGKSILTIDNRTMPNEGDTLKLNFTGAKTATYQLEIVPSSLGRQSFALYDKYLNAFSPLNSTDTTRVTFCVNTSIAGSKAADRFTIIVLKSKMNSGVLPVTFTKVKAYAKEKAILVDWNVASESGILYYEVQKSANGNSFSTAGNVSASGAGAYSFTDAMPAAGMNYYRVKSVGKNGDVRYTDVVNAQVTEAATAGSSAVSVYPNPLTGTTFNLTLTNMEAGSYTLSVINQNGSAVFNKNITHNGGTATRKVTLTKGLSAGVYYIKITSANGTASFVKIAAN